jgi:hypothetical protein
VVGKYGRGGVGGWGWFLIFESIEGLAPPTPPPKKPRNRFFCSFVENSKLMLDNRNKKKEKKLKNHFIKKLWKLKNQSKAGFLPPPFFPSCFS